MDFYEVLEITPSASQRDIKEAYRRLARECHPDLHPDDPKAEERFKKINKAYEVLSDPEERSQYNRFGDVVRPGDIAVKIFGPGQLNLTIWGYDPNVHPQAALRIVKSNISRIINDLETRNSKTYEVNLEGLKVDLIVRWEKPGKVLRAAIVSRDDLFGPLFW